MCSGSICGMAYKFPTSPGSPLRPEFRNLCIRHLVYDLVSSCYTKVVIIYPCLLCLGELAVCLCLVSSVKWDCTFPYAWLDICSFVWVHQTYWDVNSFYGIFTNLSSDSRYTLQWNLLMHMENSSLVIGTRVYINNDGVDTFIWVVWI